MTDRAPAPHPTFAQLEENVRQRLIAHGQHGALAEFGKYTSAVHEKLQVAAGAAETAKAEAGDFQGRATPTPAPVPTSAQSKPAPKAKAPRKAKAGK